MEAKSERWKRRANEGREERTTKKREKKKKKKKGEERTTEAKSEATSALLRLVAERPAMCLVDSLLAGRSATCAKLRLVASILAA